MKSTYKKTTLAIAKETVRSLGTAELRRVAGGVNGSAVNPNQHPMSCAQHCDTVGASVHNVM